MSDLTPEELARLTSADPNDLASSIAHALRFDGRRHHHRADECMARIVAEHIVKFLADSRYVVMRKPPTMMHSTNGHFPRKD